MMTEYENEVLRQTIGYLKEHWFEEHVGIVAASLIEGDQTTTATSRYTPSEKRWLHAEPAVLLKLDHKPRSSSVMVVTLSPCAKPSNSRFGIPYSQLLLESNISQVRFGCLDTKQTPKIEVGELTNDKALLQVCASLYQLFSELPRFAGDPNPWNEIKKEVGLKPFL